MLTYADVCRVQLLAGILHIGDIDFAAAKDGSACICELTNSGVANSDVANSPTLALTCAALGVWSPLFE